MKFRSLNAPQKLILNYLYYLRNTPMLPPDQRVSVAGIKQVLGFNVDISAELDNLKNKGLVLSFQINGEEYYKITLAGVGEIEKREIIMHEREISTSKIGIKTKRKQIKI